MQLNTRLPNPAAIVRTMFSRAWVCMACAIVFACSGLAAQAKGLAPPARHTVVSEGHPLALWSRVPTKPQRAILLLHGRTWSALPNYDLQVPQSDRSILVALSKLGYATYALDMRGYGSTPRNLNGWNTPNEAAEDVATTLKWINQRHPKLGKPVLFGWSMGSLVAHLTTQMHPELLSDLVLYGYPRDPASTSPALPSPTEPPREVNTAKRAASDFISPEVTSQQLIETYVAAALQADPVRADWHHNDQYSQLNPAKITRPTLVLHGDRDPSTPQAAQSRLFVALGTVDKQWVILPGGDHAAMLEDTHDAFIAAIHAFVARPQVRNAQH